MLAYFYGEGLRDFWRHKALHGFAVFVTALSLYVLGFSQYLVQNVGALVNSWGDRLEVRVFLDDGLPMDRMEALAERFRSEPTVSDVTLISPDEALRILGRMAPAFGGAAEAMGENPLPYSLSLRLKSPVDIPRVQALVRSAGKLPGVGQVLFDWAWVEKLKTYSRFVALVGWFLFAALGGAALFTVGAISRILALSRREEIDILHFLGATATSIRGPFVAGGSLMGLAAGALALSGLALTHLLLGQAAGGDALLLGWLSRAFLPAADQAALLALGLAMGSVGGWTSLSFMGLGH